MLRRYQLFLWAAVCAPLLLGMGASGERIPHTKVPQTPKRFDAQIIDSTGCSVQVEELSYDGALYVPVHLGKGLVILPFEKIASLEFGREDQGKRLVHVTFQDQKTEEFHIDGNILFIGRVPWGTYQIETKDLRRIEFHAPPQP